MARLTKRNLLTVDILLGRSLFFICRRLLANCLDNIWLPISTIEDVFFMITCSGWINMILLLFLFNEKRLWERMTFIVFGLNAIATIKMSLLMVHMCAAFYLFLLLSVKLEYILCKFIFV